MLLNNFVRPRGKEGPLGEPLEILFFHIQVTQVHQYLGGFLTVENKYESMFRRKF